MGLSYSIGDVRRWFVRSALPNWSPMVTICDSPRRKLSPSQRGTDCPHRTFSRGSTACSKIRSDASFLRLKNTAYHDTAYYVWKKEEMLLQSINRPCSSEGKRPRKSRNAFRANSSQHKFNSSKRSFLQSRLQSWLISSNKKFQICQTAI